MLGFGLYVLAFGSIAWFRFAAPLLATGREGSSPHGSTALALPHETTKAPG